MTEQEKIKDLEKQITVLRIRVTELEQWKSDLTEYMFIKWKKEKV